MKKLQANQAMEERVEVKNEHQEYIRNENRIIWQHEPYSITSSQFMDGITGVDLGLVVLHIILYYIG